MCIAGIASINSFAVWGMMYKLFLRTVRASKHYFTFSGYAMERKFTDR